MAKEMCTTQRSAYRKLYRMLLDGSESIFIHVHLMAMFRGRKQTKPEIYSLVSNFQRLHIVRKKCVGCVPFRSEIPSFMGEKYQPFYWPVEPKKIHWM